MLLILKIKYLNKYSEFKKLTTGNLKLIRFACSQIRNEVHLNRYKVNIRRKKIN